MGEEASVLLKIFNNLGKEITTLENGRIPPGNYSLEWNGSDRNGKMINKGTYYYQIIVKGRYGTSSETKTLLRL